MDGLDALSNLASKMTPLDTPEKEKKKTILEGGNINNNNNNPEGEGAQPPIAMNNSGAAAALGSMADNNPPAAAVNSMPLRKRPLQNMNLTSFDPDVEVATPAPHPNPTSVDDNDNASKLREEILQELKRRRSSLLGAVPPAAAPTIQELEMCRRASLLGGDAAGGTHGTPTFMNDLYNEVARRNILTGGSSNDSLLSGIGGRTTTSSIADLLGAPSLGNYGTSSSALGMGGIIPPAAASMQYGSQNHHQQLQQLLQDNRGQGSSLPNTGNPMFAAGLSTLPPQLISTTSELQAQLLHAREEEARSALAQQRIQMELYLRQVEEMRSAAAQRDAMVHGQQQQQTLMQDRRYQDLMLTNNPPGISSLGGRYAPSLPPHQAAASLGGEYQQALKLPSKSRGKKRSASASMVTASTASASSSSKNPTADDAKCVGKLSLPSDPTFLSEAYCFLRSTCVEVFIATAQDVANASHNNGDAPTHVGQVGFRCVNCKNRTKYQQANQAVCFPTARENIFESVRNFQQLHFNACLHISNPVKMTYRTIIKRSRGPKRSNKLVRAYYSQAASEMGLIESKSHGLEYRESLRRKENEPSDEMLRIIQLAKEEDEMLLSSGTESDSSTNSFCAYVPVPVSSVYYSTGGVGSTYIRNEIDVENVKYGKFDSVCSENAKRIMAAAKKTSTPFVQPDDYEGISDYVYLLFHQLLPCKHTAATIKRRRLNAQQVQHLPGLCCKHCVEVDGINGMYYPITCDSLGDSSFSQTLMMHISTCANVPNDVKSALEELKALVKEYKTSVKRGSKKSFVEKVWRRMEEIGRKELEASLSALTAQPSTTMEHPLAQQQLPSLSYAAQPPSSHPSSRSSFTQASSQPPNQP